MSGGGVRRLQARRNEIKRIGVFKLRYIGDTLLMTPALEALKAAWPEAAITAVVTKGTEPVLVNHPAVDEIIPIDRTAPFKDYVKSMGQVRRRAFDLAIDFTGADRSAVLAFWSGAPIRAGYTGRNVIRNRFLYNVRVSPDVRTMHQVEFHLALTEALGVPSVSRSPKIVLTADEMDAADRVLSQVRIPPYEPFVVMHPGARRWYKSWPLQRFAQLGDRVSRELGLPVLLTGGAGDVAAVETIRSTMTAPCVSLAARLNLRELVGVLARTALCVGNDSGPMHMAAAVGAPTVSLFGLTDPIRWAPRGGPSHVISRECPCRPYGHRRECPEGENHCMRKISVEEVFDAARSLLAPRLSTAATGIS